MSVFVFPAYSGVLSGIDYALQIVVQLRSNNIGVEIPDALRAFFNQSLAQIIIIIHPSDVFCKSFRVFVYAILRKLRYYIANSGKAA